MLVLEHHLEYPEKASCMLTEWIVSMRQVIEILMLTMTISSIIPVVLVSLTSP